MWTHLNIKLQGFLLNLLFALILMQITGLKAVEEKNANSASKAGDYDDEYTDDDDTSNVIKTPKSTSLAYFESNVTTVYAAENEKVTLTCSPKNFDEGQHIILWYNNDILITNGNNTLNKGYEVDNKFRLTILHYDKDTSGNYSCLVMPGDIRQYVMIRPHHEAPKDDISTPGAAPNNLCNINYFIVILLIIFGIFN